MGINKGTKQLVVRPTEENMHRLSSVMHVRSKMQEVVKQLVGIGNSECGESHHLPDKVSTKSQHTLVKIEHNISSMLETLRQSGMFQYVEENRGLVNFLAGIKASPEQEKDLLSFHTIGETDYKQYVDYCILRIHATRGVQRRRRLTTFSTKRKERKRVKQIERERKNLEKCLRRKLQWIGTREDKTSDISEQLTILPYAITDDTSLPLKGTKSKTTDFLSKRYCEASLVVQNVPANWVAHSVIMEGMFMIHTPPLSHHRTILHYATSLLQKYTLKHYKAGCIEVHILFDNPECFKVSPKSLEHQRRYPNTAQVVDHKHHDFNPNLPNVRDWGNILKCKSCKRNLTEALANAMLQTAAVVLQEHTRLIVAGSFRGSNCNKAFMVTKSDSKPCSVEALETNMEEGDMRVWIHCKNSAGTRKIIFSPDTDTYHIGMSVLNDTRISECDIYVQLNREGSKYMHLSSLPDAVCNDRELGTIPDSRLLQCLQTLYVTTGCDYTSFFHGIGKVAFLKTFYQYSDFISAGTDYPGTLADITPEEESLGFLSFARLIGTAYFKQNVASFTHRTPQAHFNSISRSNISAKQHHLLWLDDVRSTCWVHAGSPADEMPSNDALMFHWRRSVWVIHMWHQCLKNHVELLPITKYGWSLNGDSLSVVWESQKNIEEVKQRILYYTSGCKCRSGSRLCNSKRCSCVRNKQPCGPACMQCGDRCVNTGQSEIHSSPLNEGSETSSDEQNSEDETTCENEEVIDDPEIEQIMREVFGNVLL